MKISLNTNIASLTAQGQLGRVEKNLSTVFERLSTGLRINRAGDDPAGLSIAEQLAVNAEIFSQGVRNLNDGISLLNIDFVRGRQDCLTSCYNGDYSGN